MSEDTEQQPTKRFPKWTVLSNLRRCEQTDWIGHSIEFFDTELQAQCCYQRHRHNGDVPTMRLFHSSDEPRLHVLDSRRMEPVKS